MKTSEDWIEWLVGSREDSELRAALIIELIRESSREGLNVQLLCLKLLESMNHPTRHDKPLALYFADWRLRRRRLGTPQEFREKLNRIKEDWCSNVSSEEYGEIYLDDRDDELAILYRECRENSVSSQKFLSLVLEKLCAPVDNYGDIFFLSTKLSGCKISPLFSIPIQLPGAASSVHF